MKKIITGVCLLFLSACGTVFCGSTQNITFNSNLKEVKIYANGALVCSSMPCRVDIDRGSSALTIIAKADGYDDEISQIKSKINPASWGNLISAYSWTTDFATSSMWKYSEDGVYINMKKTNMKKAEQDAFRREAQIKHFALLNYAEIKIGNPEYLEALLSLSGKSKTDLQTIIANAATEVELAENLAKL